MPNAVWTGTLSFGLVAVPMRLIPATEPKDVRLHLYDRVGHRVRYQRVVDTPTEAGEPAPEAREPPEVPTDLGEAPAAEQPPPLEWDQLMRGRETETGDVVLLSHQEIERARPQRSRSIDIEDFVALEDIDPVSFEKTYYAVPESAEAARPYLLLHRAMRQAGRVGIGRFVLRTKPHLVAVRPMQDVLAVETLFFGDEVRDPTTLVSGLGAVEINERELKLAVQLIEMLKTDWDPARYADTYRGELLRMLAEKAPTSRSSKESLTTISTRPSPVAELMAALKESVEAEKKAKRQATRRSG
jgi:DNA end-binding protein Ku